MLMKPVQTRPVEPITAQNQLLEPITAQNQLLEPITAQDQLLEPITVQAVSLELERQLVADPLRTLITIVFKCFELI